MSKTKNTKPNNTKPQSLFLKGWHARNRKADKRKTTPANDTVTAMAYLPAPLTIAAKGSAFGNAEARTGDARQKTLNYRALTPHAETDLFGRSAHRHRDAVRAAGRKVGRVPHRSSWRKFLWPLIGEGLDLVNGSTFDWASYSEAFDDGVIISCYVATCDSICELGSRAKVPIAKIGISERADLTERMDELNGIGYASIVRDKMGACQIEAGWDTWHLLGLPISARPIHDSPVEWSPTRLLISLPGSLDVEAFDELLKAALAPSAMVAWSTTEEGRLHCARAGIDPRALNRHSGYPQADGDLRISIAEEIYCFRPALDPAILVKIIESIIARHLLDEAKAAIDAKPIARFASTTFSGSGKQAETLPENATPAWPLFWSMTLKVSS